MSITSSSLDVKLWIKKCTLASFVVLGCGQQETPHQKWKTNSFSFTTMLQQTGRCWSWISPYVPQNSPHQNCYTRSCSMHQNHIFCPLKVYHFSSNVGPHELKNKLRFTEMSGATNSLKGIIWANTPTSACRDWRKSLKSSHYFHTRSSFLLCKKHIKMKRG